MTNPHPHVIEIHERIGMPAMQGSIDSHAYGTEVDCGVLSLRHLRVELLVLSDDLDRLTDQYRASRALDNAVT